MFTEDEYDAAGVITKFLRWAIKPSCYECKDMGVKHSFAGFSDYTCYYCEAAFKKLGTTREQARKLNYEERVKIGLTH